MFTGSRTFKIIDLGAATDLRVGINYIPKEFLLDPRYLKPQIESTLWTRKTLISSQLVYYCWRKNLATVLG